MTVEVHLRVCPKGVRTRDYRPVFFSVMPRIGECIVLDPETDRSERFYVHYIDHGVTTIPENPNEPDGAKGLGHVPVVVARWNPVLP